MCVYTGDLESSRAKSRFKFSGQELVNHKLCAKANRNNGCEKCAWNLDSVKWKVHEQSLWGGARDENPLI